MTFKERFVYDPLKDLIGKGGFSRVYRAFDRKFDMYVALKLYYANSTLDDRYSFTSEIRRAIQLNHLNLIRYIDSDSYEGSNSLGEAETIDYCTMELADGGDSRNFFSQKQDEKKLKRILVDVLKGLSYLHNQRSPIIHRDLKPSNILLKSEYNGIVAKITDFNISKKLGSEATISQQVVGTIEYMAPEQFEPKRFARNSQISTNLDLWSLGVIVYEHFIGNVPFGNRKDGVLFEDIRENILNVDVSVNYSKIPEPFRTVVSKCLTKNAEQRVNDADELIKILDISRLNNENPIYINKPDEKLNHESPVSGFITNDSKDKTVDNSPVSGFITNETNEVSHKIPETGNPYTDMFSQKHINHHVEQPKPIIETKKEEKITLEKPKETPNIENKNGISSYLWLVFLLVAASIMIYYFFFRDPNQKKQQGNLSGDTTGQHDKTKPIDDNNNSNNQNTVNNEFAANPQGYFTDPRDGQSYKWIKIGKQIWMAENLNYATKKGSWCYQDDRANCVRFGKLYSQSDARRAVPRGWHLPTKSEWETLINTLGGNGIAYKKFVSLSQLGSRDLFGGYRGTDGTFNESGKGAYFWTATEKNDNTGYYTFVYSANGISMLSNSKLNAYSVRCVED